MVKSGATVSGITVDDNTLNVLGGKVYLNSAGTGATINVGQGGSMGKHNTEGIIKGKVALRAGYMESCTVESGGTATLFYDFADLASTVQSSSLASYTSVVAGGLFNVSSSCVASTVLINGGGVHIYSAGSITDVTFSGGGVLNLHGGFAVGVSGNGGVVVSSGAQASDISL